MASLDIRSCVAVFDGSGRVALAGHHHGCCWRIPWRKVGNATITSAASNASREDLGIEVDQLVIGAALVTSTPSAITYALRATCGTGVPRTCTAARGGARVRWAYPDEALTLLDAEGRTWLRFLLADHGQEQLVLIRRDATSEFAEVNYA